MVLTVSMAVVAWLDRPLVAVGDVEDQDCSRVEPQMMLDMELPL